MRKLMLLFVSVILTMNIFAGEPVKIQEFNKTEWTSVYNESGIEILYMTSEITKKNQEVFDFLIFKIVNNNTTDVKATISMEVSYGKTGDIIAKSNTKTFEIPSNDYVVDASQRGETKLRIPVNYRANSVGTPLAEVVINNITIE